MCVGTLNVDDVTVRLTRGSAARSPVCALMELKAKRGRPLSSSEKPTTEPLGYLTEDKIAPKSAMTADQHHQRKTLALQRSQDKDHDRSSSNSSTMTTSARLTGEPESREKRKHERRKSTKDEWEPESRQKRQHTRKKTHKQHHISGGDVNASRVVPVPHHIVADQTY